jgi:ribosomal protein L7Ae-like RNA K-turn-binding protein
MTIEAEKRVTGFLGLCMRAGQLISGQEACVDTIRNGEAAIVLLDGAASENTRKRVTDASHSHSAPLYGLSEGALGHAIGKKGRMVICLKAGGMADKLLATLKDEPRL